MLRLLAFFTLADRPKQPERIAPADVPPLVRSEAYHDCDLMGAEALRGKAWTPSVEVLRRRADLVEALIQTLPLANVRMGEESALIKTSTDTLSVHLSDATIRGSDPSACEISERWSAAKDLYLPFPGSDDPTLAEIVHRVIWLSRR